jgi:hypothetical protein
MLYQATNSKEGIVMSREDYRLLFWLLAAAFAVSLFFLLALFFRNMRSTREAVQASMTFFHLQELRDEALRSDVSLAAENLKWVAEDRNRQKPALPLDRICSFQRSNVTHDIIAYLRAKTGEDLGRQPEPWVEKYGRFKLSEELPGIERELDKEGLGKR